MKVSVLTPIYNHNTEYVRQCLKSLQAQTLQEMEMILIDNGANQESKDLIAEFVAQDARFKVLHIEKNEGYGKAMNAGLDAARGEYIGIVESDDFIDPAMYEILYKIGHDNQVDLVKSLFAFKQEGKPLKIGLSFKPNEYNRVLKNLDVPDFVFKYGSYWSAIYKKEMLDKHEIRFEEQPKPSGEDIMFTLKTYFFCRNMWISHRCLYIYRQDNPNSSIRGKDERIQNCMNLYLKLNEYLEYKKYEMLDDYWYIKSRREFLNFWAAYQSNCVSKNNFALIKQVSKQLRANLERGHVQLGPLEMAIYKRIAYHPIWLYLRGALLKTKKTQTAVSTTLFGIPLKTVKQLKNGKTTKYLGGLFKNKKSGCFCKKYIATVPYYSRITKKDLVVKCFLGMPYSKNINNDINNDINTKLTAISTSINQLKRIEYNMRTSLYAQSVHPQTFARFFNCHVGEDVVLMACGPSVQYFKAFQPAKYVGVNRSFLNKEVPLDYLFVQDDLEENMAEANQYEGKLCQKFYGIIPHLRNTEIQKNYETQHIHRISLLNVQQANAKQYILNNQPYWPYDISREPLRDWGGTVFSALQFICYTHPERIYLVGCDCSDGCHFYGGRSEKFSASIRMWVDFKNYMQREMPDIEIISINPIGLKGMFKDMYTKEFVQNNENLTVDKEQIL